MPRLLILTDSDIGELSGGAELHLRSLVANLDYSKFKVHVVQLRLTVPQAEGHVAGATFSHLPTGRLLSAHGLKRIMQVYRLLRKGEYDCVLSFFETADVLSVTAASLAGVRALLSSRRDTGYRYSKKMRWFYRIINGRFSRIIAVSEAVCATLRDSGVNETIIRLIYNGVDMTRFKGQAPGLLRKELGLPREACVLAMIANLDPVKDHMTVIKCLQTLHGSGKHMHLILAGNGPLRTELEHAAIAAGLNAYVHFLGLRADVPAILADADIFLLSSLTEGLSNALLEAMAGGKPVVATRVGGNPEVIVDGVTGFLVPVGDSAAMGAAILRLSESPGLRAAMGAAGRERVASHFSLSTMVKRYVDAIEQTVAERGSRKAGLEASA